MPLSDFDSMNWTQDLLNNYTYPDDFKDSNNETIYSNFTQYVCGKGTEKYRLFDSNGIPDHDVMQGNKNSPCEVHWFIKVSVIEMILNL